MTFAIDAALTQGASALKAAILSQTCTISTPGTPTANAYGGEDAGTPTTATARCKVDDLTGSDQKIAERLGVVADTTIWLEVAAVVTPTCTITVNGHAYAVSYVNEDAQRMAVRAVCRRVIT